MKEIIRSLFPQWMINKFYHLPRAFLAYIFYGFPTRNLTVIGVTGTDGKTTTVNMIYQVLKSAGKKVSMVSTVNAVVGGQRYDTGFHVTSPDPLLVQKFAKKAKDNGDEFLILEVTSHALDQYRFWGIKFDVAVITNVTHEHLDYHKTFGNYLNTKFKLIKDVKFAVVNENLNRLPRRFAPRNDDNKRMITFGHNRGDFNQEDINLKLKIPGDYNVENALAAIVAASVLGVNQEIARKSVESFKGIVGRMEEVKNRRGFRIVIDYAHTPNGLEQALKTLRSQHPQGKLISLIGCEGKRDVGKRSLMGEIATKLSDMVVVTAVDPRGQIDTINRQISNGAKKAGARMDENFFIIDDRAKAIDFAINSLAKKGDTVGIFGKGHERSMNLDGKKEIHWSDEEAVKKALNNGQ
ncbi:UDP-N-acetylmuramoyl-L-alanyl-D-glutamate--2,6-diaminopimelate ligase [Candidatus Microgenomates bacterium]|nr:UDP-N-acetylmuramoyl-L-alanyl-D-glutamate--2,6-diaminopimelate ligase [Candidatus Microgenomates bacterium]